MSYYGISPPRPSLYFSLGTEEADVTLRLTGQEPPHSWDQEKHGPKQTQHFILFIAHSWWVFTHTHIHCCLFLLPACLPAVTCQTALCMHAFTVNDFVGRLTLNWFDGQDCAIVGVVDGFEWMMWRHDLIRLDALVTNWKGSQKCFSLCVCVCCMSELLCICTWNS